MNDEGDRSAPQENLMKRLLKEASDLAKQGRIDEMESAIKQILGRDLLTGILNRVGFLERLEEDIQSCVESADDEQPNRRRGDEGRRMIQNPLCLVFLDLDRFKNINNDVGYVGGDVVLKTTARCLTEGFRSSDIVGRIYGDEFALALRGTTEETVRERLLDVQRQLRDYPWNFDDIEQDSCRHLKEPVTFTVDLVMLDGEEDFEKVERAFRNASDSVLEKKKERPR